MGRWRSGPSRQPSWSQDRRWRCAWTRASAAQRAAMAAGTAARLRRWRLPAPTCRASGLAECQAAGPARQAGRTWGWPGPGTYPPDLSRARGAARPERSPAGSAPPATKGKRARVARALERKN
eukprot:6182439-Pleurochrysis_carterae.AAC.1